jgi:hypothetical protein
MRQCQIPSGSAVSGDGRRRVVNFATEHLAAIPLSRPIVRVVQRRFYRRRTGELWAVSGSVRTEILWDYAVRTGRNLQEVWSAFRSGGRLDRASPIRHTAGKYPTSPPARPLLLRLDCSGAVSAARRWPWTSPEPRPILMAKGNDGNYLQHSIEVDAAVRLAGTDPFGRLHIALTHGIAPFEPSEEPSNPPARSLLLRALSDSYGPHRDGETRR